MNAIRAADWFVALQRCGVKTTVAALWSPVFERHVQPERFSTGAREIDDFVGQVLHETALLTALQENLNYSADRLTRVWPLRFPSVAAALPYAFNPAQLAEKVYGGRLGNTRPGEGFKYIGRGIPMVTGRANYAELAKFTGLPLLDHPEILAQPDAAMQCGVLWWEGHVPDSAIDSCERVTRAVNGGTIGLDLRQALTASARRALAPWLAVSA